MPVLLQNLPYLAQGTTARAPASFHFTSGGTASTGQARKTSGGDEKGDRQLGQRVGDGELAGRLGHRLPGQVVAKFPLGERRGQIEAGVGPGVRGGTGQV